MHVGRAGDAALFGSRANRRTAERPRVQLTDDRLIAAMRDFVTATNRLENLAARGSTDLRVLEQVSEQRRQAGELLQDALVERGWRRPSYS